MSWKSRAISADQPNQSSGGDWKSRAVSADSAPKQDDSSLANDIWVKTSENLTFGAAPAAAGVGAGLGASVGQLQRGDIGLVERIKGLPQTFGDAFSEARRDRQIEEDDVGQRRPGLSTGIAVGTTLATLPLTAIKGVQAAAKGGKIIEGVRQSAKIGGMIGAANAAGRADNVQEAVEMIGAGTLAGGAAQVGGNALVKTGGAALKAAGAAGNKIASALTGISEKEIQTYATRADDVKGLLKKHGGDIAAAADDVRNGIGKDLQVTRQKLNNQINEAISSPALAGRRIDGSVIIQKLEDGLKQIQKNTAQFNSEEINQLKNVVDLTKQAMSQEGDRSLGFMTKAGEIDVKTLNSLKEELQAIAKASYNNGQMIFPRGGLAARAAKGAAAEARRLLNEAVPEVAKANQQLSRLHAIEDVMNKNLIRAGKPEAALVGAGSGNARNANILKNIDKITGGKALEQAENLAAAKTFGNISLNPMDYTGKAVARMATGGGLGYITGGEQGAIVGTALTSPAALRLALDTARVSGRLTRAIGSGTGRLLPSGAGRDAVRAGLVKETTDSARHSETAVERRLRELAKKKNNSASGQ